MCSPVLCLASSSRDVIITQLGTVLMRTCVDVLCVCSCIVVSPLLVLATMFGPRWSSSYQLFRWYSPSFWLFLWFSPSHSSLCWLFLSFYPMRPSSCWLFLGFSPLCPSSCWLFLWFSPLYFSPCCYCGSFQLLFIMPASCGSVHHAFHCADCACGSVHCILHHVGYFCGSLHHAAAPVCSGEDSGWRGYRSSHVRLQSSASCLQEPAWSSESPPAFLRSLLCQHEFSCFSFRFSAVKLHGTHNWNFWTPTRNWLCMLRMPEETVPIDDSSGVYFTNTPHPEWNLCERDPWPLLFKLMLPATIFCNKRLSSRN